MKYFKVFHRFANRDDKFKLLSLLFVTIFTYVYVHACFMYLCINAYLYITTLMWLPLQNVDEINVSTDRGNNGNEMWHWTNDEIGVAVQSWVLVLVEFMAW